MTFCNCHVQFPLELVARLFHAAVSESVVVYPPACPRESRSQWMKLTWWYKCSTDALNRQITHWSMLAGRPTPDVEGRPLCALNGAPEAKRLIDG